MDAISDSKTSLLELVVEPGDLVPTALLAHPLLFSQERPSIAGDPVPATTLVTLPPVSQSIFSQIAARVEAMPHWQIGLLAVAAGLVLGVGLTLAVGTKAAVGVAAAAL